MARPKSEDKRFAILESATRIIDGQGLGAPTATIARVAGVSNGSLFTYFKTKADLFNELYLALKTEMAGEALKGYPEQGNLHAKTHHVWTNWIRWAVVHPEKRRTLAQLSVSDQIRPETRVAGNQIMAGLLDLMEQVRQGGSLHNLPTTYVGALMNSFADTTMDFIIRDSDRAQDYLDGGFDAFWRSIN